MKKKVKRATKKNGMLSKKNGARLKFGSGYGGLARAIINSK